MGEKIKVVLIEPGKLARIEEIDKGLLSYQTIVGGYIEQICPYDDPVALICNEEGKINGLELNRALVDEQNDIWDIVAGTFFICGLGEEDYCSLSDELAEKYLEKFKYPERIEQYGRVIIRHIMDKEE